jgi:hypothetical protein
MPYSHTVTEPLPDRLARTISIVLHPIFTIATLMWLTTRGGGRLLPFAGMLLLVAIPLTLFMRGQVRRGTWENVDASRPAERHSLFAVIGVICAALGGWLAFTGAHVHARGAFAAAIMALVAWALLRWIKLSLHMAFGVYAACMLMKFQLTAGIVMLLLMPLLAWSRLRLGRHRMAEVIGGSVLGAVTAAVALFT